MPNFESIHISSSTSEHKLSSPRFESEFSPTSSFSSKFAQPSQLHTSVHCNPTLLLEHRCILQPQLIHSRMESGAGGSVTQTILWSYVGDKIGFQVLARRSRLLWQGSVSRLECLGRVSFVGMVL